MFRELAGGLRSLPRRSWLVFTLAFGLIFIIFLWHLSNLTTGMSAKEISYASGSHNLSTIVNNPANAPHKLIQLAIFKIVPDHPSLLRLPSVAFAITFCLAFYKLAKTWFGRAIGWFATLIFASLPLLVVSARQATASVLFFAPIIFIALYGWFSKTKDHKTWAWLSVCLAAAVLVFTPGMLVWLLGAMVVCRKPLVRAANELAVWALTAGSLLVLASLVGLAVAAFNHHNLIRNLFLVPVQLPDWLPVLKHTGWMALSLFVRTGHGDPLIVGRLPLLNILMVALLVFGLYAMFGVTRKKTLFLSLSILYAIILAGSNDNLELLAFGLPAMGIFIAAGLRYLYIEWRSIFPRNPVPKTFALVLIAFVAATQVYFGLRYSLSAWPNTPQTRAAYVLK